MRYLVDIAPKGTCWWINPAKREDRPNQRQDMLFAINRFYIRDGQFAGRYCYQIVIGRLKILVA